MQGWNHPETESNQAQQHQWSMKSTSMIHALNFASYVSSQDFCHESALPTFLDFKFLDLGLDCEGKRNGRSDVCIWVIEENRIFLSTHEHFCTQLGTALNFRFAAFILLNYMTWSFNWVGREKQNKTTKPTSEEYMSNKPRFF